MAIERKPTPSGAITALFDRLNELHFRAGEPPVRTISRKLGQGVVSPSTVHNILSGPRVPRWGTLELVVEVLGGDLEEFRRLWQAARKAERRTDELSTEALRTPPSARSPVTASPPESTPAIWCQDIPFANPFFTGRTREITRLHALLTGGPSGGESQPRQALFGMAGVGKTEIAAQYVHRYGDAYDVVWWIPADEEDGIRRSLVELGDQLGLAAAQADDDHTIAAVINAIRIGHPYARALLVFDHAVKPEMIRKYTPPGQSHVIITSRLQDWRGTIRTAGLQIDCWTSQETVEFLNKRVQSRAQEDSGGRLLDDPETLADAVGNLPLAAEHAVSYLIEFNTPATRYLRHFEADAYRMLSHELDTYSSAPVPASCDAARQALTPESLALLRLLAFFSAQPIAEELLAPRGRVGLRGLPDPLSSVVGDAGELRRAVGELARFSLIRFDSVHNTICLHRVVQLVTRGKLERAEPEAARAFTTAAHVLLAESDPNEPDHERNDQVYGLSRPHLLPSGAIDSENPEVRALIINQMRNLHRQERYAESLEFGGAILRRWRAARGADDFHALSLAVEMGVALRRTGRVLQAFELNSETMERLRRQDQENEAYLNCARSVGADLRALGRYREALDNDRTVLPAHDRVLAADDPRVLFARANLAASMRCLGRFAEALEIDRSVHNRRLRLFAKEDHQVLDAMFHTACDLRHLGRYDEALQLLRSITAVERKTDPPWKRARLLRNAELALALRAAGFYTDALHYGRQILGRHEQTLGAEHRQSLMVATNLVNDLRIADDLDGARRLAEQTIARLCEATGTDHVNTHAARADLAAVRRLQGDAGEARELDEEALACFTRVWGEEHSCSLAVLANLATDLASLRMFTRARELGETAWERSRRVLGEVHPRTLAIAANLALDLEATGADASARELREQSMAGYKAVLGSEHPETRAVAYGSRITLEAEPLSP
jgi:tetratricopeptide (TPR) repeat protein